jgi:hypothetical protein
MLILIVIQRFIALVSLCTKLINLKKPLIAFAKPDQLTNYHYARS